MGDSGVLRTFFDHQAPLADHPQNTVVDGNEPRSLTEVIVRDLVTFDVIGQAPVCGPSEGAQDKALALFIKDVDRRIGEGVGTLAKTKGVKDEHIPTGAPLNILNDGPGADSNIVAAKALIHFRLVEDTAVAATAGRWRASPEANKAFTIPATAGLTGAALIELARARASRCTKSTCEGRIGILDAGAIFAAIEIVDTGQANGVDLQRAAAANVQWVVSHAERRILIGVADDAAATVLAADRAWHTGTRVDFTTAAAQVCLVVKALQRPILGTEEGATARLTAGVAIATAFFRAFGAEEDRLGATKGCRILLCHVGDTCVPGRPRFRPTGVNGTTLARITARWRWWGRQAGDVQQGQ